MNFRLEFLNSSSDQSNSCSVIRPYIIKKSSNILETAENHSKTAEKPYSKILLSDTNSSGLISKFLKEESRLKKSDACSFSFGLEDSLKRLEIGYNATLIDYNVGDPSDVYILGDSENLQIISGRSKVQINYTSLLGLLFGNKSLTFQKYLNRNLKSEFGFWDCFSLVTPVKTFDLVLQSQVAKYDLCMVISWKISLYSNNFIPLSKFQITLFAVKEKVKQMSKEKNLSVKELFLVISNQLAIFKVITQRQFAWEKKEVIKDLLDKSFCHSSKLYRVCFFLKPINFKMSTKYLGNEKEQYKARFLSGKRALKIKSHKAMVKLDWNTIARQKTQILSLPTTKKLIVRQTKCNKLKYRKILQSQINRS